MIGDSAMLNSTIPASLSLTKHIRMQTTSLKLETTRTCSFCSKQNSYVDIGRWEGNGKHAKQVIEETQSYNSEFNLKKSAENLKVKHDSPLSLYKKKKK